MGAKELLEELLQAGFTLRVEAGRLAIRPASRLTQAQREAIHRSKGDMMALLSAPSTAFRLTPAEADRAHVRPWDDSSIERYVRRVAHFMRLGIDSASDLAEFLHLRDTELDDRRVCVECRHLERLSGGEWQCSVAFKAEVANPLPPDLLTRLQRCPPFRPYL